MLKKLAEATGGTKWDEIALNLGTSRTPHACFVRCNSLLSQLFNFLRICVASSGIIAETLILGRYMTRHCVAVNNRKWERQEDDRFFQRITVSAILR